MTILNCKCETERPKRHDVAGGFSNNVVNYKSIINQN